MNPVSTHQYFKDFRFYVVATVQDYCVDYIIYDIQAETETGEPLFPKKGLSYFEPTPSIDESSPYLHGSVKWDGCSNWYFDEQDDVMLHGCERSHLTRFGEIMGACWDWTKLLLTTWNP